MAVTSIVHERIKNHIENTCKGNFETSYLKSLEEVSAPKELTICTIKLEFVKFLAQKET